MVPRPWPAVGAAPGRPGAPGVVPVGPRPGGVRGDDGVLDHRRPHHRQAHHRHRRAPHPDRVVRSRVGGARAAVRSAGRLAGVPHPQRPQPGARVDGVRRDCGPRGGLRRPELADRGEPSLRRNRDRRRACADGNGRGFDSGLGRADDRVQPRADGHPDRARVACRVAHRAGLLQLLCLADGGDREPPAALAGDGLSRGDRGGIRGLQHGGTGPADVDGDRPARRG